MIKTVSDLLQVLKENEEKRMSSFMPITHAPTIGAMYEGATAQILEKTIFDGLNLTVCSGFIKNSKDELSRQIDCMIAVGNGIQIPNTSNHIFDISDVVAIIEVKKTFYGSELEEAMDWSRDFQHRISEPPEAQEIDLLRDAWRSITGQTLPKASEVASLPHHLEMIYHLLAVEFSSPLRIFFGYEGYASESRFRRGLGDYLEKLVHDEKQFLGGPMSFPDVMICRNSTIFKLNGMPYPGPMTAGGDWVYLGSRGVNPLHVLLEFLWTRLSYKFGLSSNIFGDDLEREGINSLLIMKALQEGAQIGWGYEYLDLPDDTLNGGNLDVPWEPVEVSEIETRILFVLGDKHKINENDPDFQTFMTSEGLEVRDAIESLCSKRLICYQNGTIRYLTDECVVISLPDGRFVAGENKSGRMTRWIEKMCKTK